MGGTTISRRIAFDLREKYPTVILKQYRLLDTADKIVELYDQTKKTIFVVAEAHQFSRDNIYELYDAIRSRTRPVVFLVVQRGSKNELKNIDHKKRLYTTILNLNETNEFLNEYRRHLERYDDLELKHKKKMR
ncbi:MULTISPECIES: hypothetical protein [Laceyella]|jgi:hypothetical protein|uniref:AAA domain-containing protein n=1 Tax=Laceyella sediminis TaxID=573074 RepID=A0ABX5EU05_9BACL|nr:hypothetical protein [Laceyella sediminis]MRG29753.1 hypothetical protein [Laceyella tengchongensis]PRZ17454.1 hypothetical protein CLV36_101569 [Laceyella sediminis]